MAGPLLDGDYDRCSIFLKRSPSASLASRGSSRLSPAELPHIKPFHLFLAPISPPVPVSSAPAARLTACLHTNVVLPPNYAQASDMCQGRHVSAELMMLRRTAHCPSDCMHECECVCVRIREPRHVNVARTLLSD